GEPIEEHARPLPIAEWMRHLGEEPEADEPLLVEGTLREVVRGEPVEERARVVLATHFVVEAREDAVDDRIRPERQLAQVGLERLGKLVEPALAASQEVELQSVRHHSVPARCRPSELERLAEQALGIVETTFEQREQRLVYPNQPVLRRLTQLLGKLRHLAQVRASTFPVAEPEQV